MKNLRRGFTILEMVVVLTIIALVIGALAPVTIQVVERNRIKTTNQNLDAIEEAIRAYYLDNYKDNVVARAFPRQNLLIDLQNDNNAPGWNGPYLLQTIQNGFNSLTQDAWANNYRSQITQFESGVAIQYRITSLGPNRALGGGDDIVRDINTKDILKTQTRNEIETINTAFRIYTNRGFNPPLSNNPNSIVTNILRLQNANLLPSGTANRTEFSRDEWNDNYRVEGALVGVSSRNL